MLLFVYQWLVLNALRLFNLLSYFFIISGSKSRTKIREEEREEERDREETFAFKFKMSPPCHKCWNLNGQEQICLSLTDFRTFATDNQSKKKKKVSKGAYDL